MKTKLEKNFKQGIFEIEKNKKLVIENIPTSFLKNNTFK